MKKIWGVGSSQDERINFDAMVERIADAFITSTTPAERVDYSAREYLSDTNIEFVQATVDELWQYDDTYIISDDPAEARCRFESVFDAALKQAKNG